jgi:hypothetical protein
MALVSSFLMSLRIVTVLFCVFALTACGEGDRTKNVLPVSQAGQNGPQKPSKPTLETGEHAASMMALNTFSIKQAARILDLIAFRERSLYKHACQTIASQTRDELREEVTVLTDDKNCPQNNRGSSKPNEAWGGQEIFEVTYTDKNWREIHKISLVRATRVSIESNSPQLTATLMIDHETVQFIRTTADVYNFEYKGSAIYDRTPENRSQDRQRSELLNNLRATEDDSLQKRKLRAREAAAPRQESEVTLMASGTVHFNPRTPTTWNIFNLNMTYVRTRNNNPEKEAHMSLSDTRTLQNLALSCGMPVAEFSVEQTVQTANKSSSYRPSIVIDQTGRIVVARSRLQPFQSPTCRGGAQNLQGFYDFFQTFKAAEEINIMTTAIHDRSLSNAAISAQVARPATAN